MISSGMLAAFVKVAELRSVSRAAAELGVGKSVVSKRVAQLEATLQTTLFTRSTRQIVPSAAGEAYLEHARRALQELAAADERLRELRVQLTGTLRVTATVSWGQQVLAPALAGFLAQHPALELQLLLADRMLDLAQERIDLALRWSHQAPRELHAEQVAQVDWVLAATPAYRLAHGLPGAPAELAGHAAMGYWREADDEPWVLQREGDRREVVARSRFHANNPESVAAATLAGLGIGLLPGYLCRDALADGRLERVLPGWTPVTRFGTRIIAVATPERLRLQRCRALLEYLRQALG